MGTGNGARPIQLPVPIRCPTTSQILVHRQAIRFTKRQTDMPFEYAMRFFTPELYLRFNSRNNDEALEADQEWEVAIASYNARLEALRIKMPSQVVTRKSYCDKSNRSLLGWLTHQIGRRPGAGLRLGVGCSGLLFGSMTKD
jgi:hypothetical protein